MYKIQNKGYLYLFDLIIKYHILLNLIKNESLFVMRWKNKKNLVLANLSISS